MSQATEIVILKDDEGSYFLLPKAVLEQARVPAEHVGEVERLIAARAEGELTDEELESVSGGGGSLSSYGTFRAPAGLTLSGFQGTWGFQIGSNLP